jgi:hypothetical protein
MTKAYQLAGRFFQFVVATQSNDHNPAECKTKDKHSPLHEPGKCHRVISSQAYAAPFFKSPASQQAHQSRTKYTAISHTSQHPAYDDCPKGTGCNRLCTHVNPPQLFIIQDAYRSRPGKTRTNQPHLTTLYCSSIVIFIDIFFLAGFGRMLMSIPPPCQGNWPSALNNLCYKSLHFHSSIRQARSVHACVHCCYPITVRSTSLQSRPLPAILALCCIGIKLSRVELKRQVWIFCCWLIKPETGVYRLDIAGKLLEDNFR